MERTKTNFITISVATQCEEGTIRAQSIKKKIKKMTFKDYKELAKEEWPEEACMVKMRLAKSIDEIQEEDIMVIVMGTGTKNKEREIDFSPAVLGAIKDETIREGEIAIVSSRSVIRRWGEIEKKKSKQRRKQ